MNILLKMNEKHENIASVAIASEAAAVQGTVVESNNPNTATTGSENDNAAPVLGESSDDSKTRKKGISRELAAFLAVSILGRDPRQRKLNMNHVKQLANSIKKLGRIIDSIKVVPARQMIGEGEKIYGRDGLPLTLDTPDIDKYYVVIDGDHRLAAYRMLMEEDKSLKIDCYVEMADTTGMTCRQYQDTVNNTAMGWGAGDRMASVAKKYEHIGKRVIDLMLEWKEKFNIGCRESYALLHLIDGYRKSMVVSSQEGTTLDDNLVGTPENIKRGKELLEAILIGCQEKPRLARSLAPVYAIINAYSKLPDCDKGKGVEDIKLAMKSLTSSELSQIDSKKTVPERSAEFTAILNTKMATMRTEDGRRAIEKEAEKNTSTYEKTLSEQEQKNTTRLNGKSPRPILAALKKRLDLKALPKNLKSEITSLATQDGVDADKIVLFINGLSDSQVTDLKAYGREPSASDKLKAAVSSAWSQFHGTDNN